MDNGGIFFFFSLQERQRVREIRSNVVEKERKREGERKIKKKWNVIVSSNSDFCRFTRGKKARDQIIG